MVVARRARPLAGTLPNLRRGVASLIAVPGTGRLRQLATSLSDTPNRPADPYRYVEELESALESMRAGRRC